MHYRRVASFILGAWVIGSLFALYITSDSWSAVDRIFQMPPPQIAEMTAALHPDQMQLLLRYYGAEQARICLHDWGIIQLLLGPLLIVLLLRARHVSRLMLGVAGAMLIFGAFSSFVLLPEIAYLSRILHFSAGWSGDRARYLALHLTYFVLEALKLALAMALAVYLFAYRKHARPTVAVPVEEELGRAADASD